MSRVPQDQVVWRVEDPVESKGQLDDAEVRPEMPSVSRHGLDEKQSDLGRQLVEFVVVETTKICRPIDVLQIHCRAFSGTRLHVRHARVVSPIVAVRHRSRVTIAWRNLDRESTMRATLTACRSPALERERVDQRQPPPLLLMPGTRVWQHRLLSSSFERGRGRRLDHMASTALRTHATPSSGSSMPRWRFHPPTRSPGSQSNHRSSAASFPTAARSSGTSS